MSLLICIIEKNNVLHIASDEKVIDLSNDRAISHLKLMDNIYLGFVGNIKEGYGIYLELKEINSPTSNDIISNAERLIQKSEIYYNIFIMGKNENDELFCWSKDSTGSNSYLNKNIPNIRTIIGASNQKSEVEAVSLVDILLKGRSSTIIDLSKVFKGIAEIDNLVSDTFFYNIIKGND